MHSIMSDVADANCKSQNQPWQEVKQVLQHNALDLLSTISCPPPWVVCLMLGGDVANAEWI